MAAPRAQRAAFARGLARGAHSPAVVDEPVMRAAPRTLGDVFHQLLLGFEDVRRVRQTKTVGDAEDVRIDRDGVRAEGAAHDDIRRLSADAGQAGECGVVRGYLAAKAGNQLARGQGEVLCLVAVDAAGLDIRLDVFGCRFSHRVRAGIGGKERGRDHVDLHVRTLRGEDDRNEQLPWVIVIERGLCVRVQALKLREDLFVLFCLRHTAFSFA